MICRDTPGEHPAVRIPNEIVELALDLAKMVGKIKAIGGEGDTEVNLRLKPDGQVANVKYSFSERRNKKSA